MQLITRKDKFCMSLLQAPFPSQQPEINGESKEGIKSTGPVSTSFFSTLSLEVML